MYACGDLSAGHSRLVVDIMCCTFTVMLTAIKRQLGETCRVGGEAGLMVLAALQ